MTRLTIFALILGFALATDAIARDYPAYYPKGGIGRAGIIDAVHLDEDRVVIDDVPYQLAKDVVVHSLNAYSVPKTRLRPGVKIAFKVGGNRTITKFWLLPGDYDTKRRR